jgi:GNAT superfamily N-acetyltransferase
MQRHFADAHADLGLSDMQISNYVHAEARLTGGKERLEEIGAVSVEPVSAARLAEILSFFDHDAFADNAGWASCYCVFHHFAGDQAAWGEQPSDSNRAELGRRIEAGTTTGAVAYVDGKVAGWVNASPASQYPHHVDDDHGEFAAAEVGTIACFVIAPPYRGHGLARRLLDAAVVGLAAEGVKAIEAYPNLDAKTPAAAYHGPLPLLLDAGFELVSEENGVGVARKVL